MQKISITQADLDSGNGQFNNYMRLVAQRLTARNVNPKTALLAAVSMIEKDGLKISLGSFKDAAAVNVSKWFDNLYGDRQHISYCLPPVAYGINGATYLLRMPILRPKAIPLTEAVIDLTDLSSQLISSKQLKSLAETYNEFYDALHLIARFDKATVIHLETSAQYLVDSTALYAHSRWESLHFVEKAMKEVLAHAEIAIKGADGHDIRGALNDAWLEAGKPPLSLDLLDHAWCSQAMRYEKTPQPQDATILAHHAAIRLGAKIAACLPAVPPMVDEISIPPNSLKHDAWLAVIRAVSAIGQSQSAPIRLTR